MNFTIFVHQRKTAIWYFKFYVTALQFCAIDCYNYLTAQKTDSSFHIINNKATYLYSAFLLSWNNLLIVKLEKYFLWLPNQLILLTRSTKNRHTNQLIIYLNNSSTAGFLGNLLYSDNKYFKHQPHLTCSNALIHFNYPAPIMKDALWL